MKRFGNMFPERLFDVGIAEEHAVTFAAGLALGGLRPVVAIYSSFLQRAVDQILHDVCMQNLPVVFAVDRAGLVGSDGETHHGCFDLSYLSMMPNMTVMAPKNKWELSDMLKFDHTPEEPGCHPLSERRSLYRSGRLPCPDRDGKSGNSGKRKRNCYSGSGKYGTDSRTGNRKPSKLRI